MIPKRLWFRKTGTARYISHLDLNRYFARVFRKARLPLWYTEGFHPHPFMVFTLPLSLGMTGLRESLDIRLTGDMGKEELLARLNVSLAEGIRFLDVADPQKKAGEVAFAAYTLWYEPEDGDTASLFQTLQSLCQEPEVTVEKRSKSSVKPFDLAPYLQGISMAEEGDTVRVSLLLPAGSRENVSPKLLGEALRGRCGAAISEMIERTELYDADRTPFR